MTHIESLTINPRTTLAWLTAMTMTSVIVPISGFAEEAGLAYVSNQQGSVSIVDLTTMEIRANIDSVGRSPRGIGITADGRWLVTANKDDENISVVDIAGGTLSRTIPIGKNPEFVRILGGLAFVTFEPSAQSGGAPSKDTADQKKGDDDDNVPGHVAIVDLKAGKTIRDIVGKPETEGVEFSKDGKELIVANESDNSLSVIDIVSGRLLKTVSLAKFGVRPRGIKISPDGRTFVTTLELSNKMVVLNEKLEPIREVATGKFPYGVSFDRAGKRVFVTANRDQVLQVFDARTWEKIGEVSTAERCWHFSFTPDDQRILLACGKSNELLVIDADKLEIVKRIANLKTPWGVVTFPKSMGSLDQP